MELPDHGTRHTVRRRRRREQQGPRLFELRGAPVTNERHAHSAISNGPGPDGPAGTDAPSPPAHRPHTSTPRSNRQPATHAAVSRTVDNG